MSKKQLITQLLAEQKYDQLVILASQEHSKTLRYVQMNLYHDYKNPLRWFAIEGFGVLAKELAPKEPARYRNLLNRLLWSMDPESGNVPWGSPEAMASIIVNQPGLFGRFVSSLISSALANPICHQGLWWAILKIGKTNPSLIGSNMNQLVNISILNTNYK